MKRRSFILSCIAVFFTLVFSLKAGAGLFLHDLLHSNTANNKLPQQENKKDKDTNYNCTCIDDFLMPFAGSEQIVFAQPMLSVAVLFTLVEEKITFHTPVYSFLRGPPVYLL